MASPFSLDPTKNSELTFQDGTIAAEWVEIPGVEFMDEAQLEAASDAVGAMTFARPEDGAFNPRHPNEFFFVTTGGAAGANELGRLYSLRMAGGNPMLTVAYNADQVVAAGGDIAISPDNIDASRQYLMINEDGTDGSRPVMAEKGRDGSIWRFGIVYGKPGVDVSSATRVAELDPPGRDGVDVGAGSGRRAASSTCPTSGARTRGSSTSRPIRRPRRLRPTRSRTVSS